MLLSSVRNIFLPDLQYRFRCVPEVLPHSLLQDLLHVPFQTSHLLFHQMVHRSLLFPERLPHLFQEFPVQMLHLQLLTVKLLFILPDLQYQSHSPLLLLLLCFLFPSCLIHHHFHLLHLQIQ